jgi:nicotinic acetylcholine receptor
VDERLFWNPAEYNNLEILRIPCQRLWLPDVVLYNRLASVNGYSTK